MLKFLIIILFIFVILTLVELRRKEKRRDKYIKQLKEFKPLQQEEDWDYIEGTRKIIEQNIR